MGEVMFCRKTHCERISYGVGTAEHLQSGEFRMRNSSSRGARFNSNKNLDSDGGVKGFATK